jgi:hypothetical protein
MNLSSKTRWFLASVLAALGGLVVTDSASAQYITQNPVPLGARGFQISMGMLNYWQNREENAYRETYAAPAEAMVVEPRYVTIIGPDGRSRSFQIEGPITIVPMRSNVVHFGANNSAGPVVWMPVRPNPVHFGSNR